MNPVAKSLRASNTRQLSPLPCLEERVSRIQEFSKPDIKLPLA